MISLSGLPDKASITEGRYFSSRSLPFQLGITTEAIPSEPRASASGVAPETTPSRSSDKSWLRSEPRAPNKSDSASASAPISTSSGEIRSNGSARTKRFRKAILTGGECRTEADLASEFHPSRFVEERDLLL